MKSDKEEMLEEFEVIKITAVSEQMLCTHCKLQNIIIVISVE